MRDAGFHLPYLTSKPLNRFLSIPQDSGCDGIGCAPLVAGTLKFKVCAHVRQCSLDFFEAACCLLLCLGVCQFLFIAAECSPERSEFCPTRLLCRPMRERLNFVASTDRAKYYASKYVTKQFGEWEIGGDGESFRIQQSNLPLKGQTTQTTTSERKDLRRSKRNGWPARSSRELSSLLVLLSFIVPDGLVMHTFDCIILIF